MCKVEKIHKKHPKNHELSPCFLKFWEYESYQPLVILKKNLWGENNGWNPGTNFLGIQLEIHAFQWNSMEFNEIRWNSIKFNEIQWNSVKFSEIQWNSMVFNRIQWDSMEFYGILWVLRDSWIFCSFRENFWPKS